MNAERDFTPRVNIRAITPKTLYADDLAGLIDIGPTMGGYRLARHVNLTNYLVIAPDSRVIFTDQDGRCFTSYAHALQFVRAQNPLKTRPLLPVGIAPTARARRRAFDRVFVENK